jgi:protein TonB
MKKSTLPIIGFLLLIIGRTFLYKSQKNINQPIDISSKSELDYTNSNNKVVVPDEKFDSSEKIYNEVQQPAIFPGGNQAWGNYLEKSLHSDVPVKKGAPSGIYKVRVSFVVSKNGDVSDVRSENDPGYGTASEAERVIQSGPKWDPAIQNGRKVNCRQKQLIIFQVLND